MENEFLKPQLLDHENLIHQKIPKSKFTSANFKAQTIKASHNLQSQFTFKNPKHEQIASEIKKRVQNGKYLSITELNLDFEFDEILFVFKTLEMKKVINLDFEVEEKKEASREWTKKEILLLLEAIHDYGDDWDQVGLRVGRSKADCILKFLKYDFEISKLIADNEEIARCVFIASRVHPRIAAVFAKETIKNENVDWAVVVNEAKNQLDLEIEKVKRLNEIVEEAELLKLNEKIEDFKGITNSVCEERVEIRENIIEIRKKIKEAMETLKKKRKNEGVEIEN